MNRKAHYLFPSQSRNCKRQWDRFRSAQSRRTRLPVPLWQAVVELARQTRRVRCRAAATGWSRSGRPADQWYGIPSRAISLLYLKKCRSGAVLESLN